MRVIKDKELKEFQSKIGQMKYRQLANYVYNRSHRICKYNLRASGKHYENSEERLNEIKEKYKKGVTQEIMEEWLGK